MSLDLGHASFAKRILEWYTRFFEPAASLAASPHRSTAEGRQMNHPIPNPPTPAVVDTSTARCPACQSASTVTTAKIPDRDSYWRCTMCGEVWNVSRSQNDRYSRPRWR